VATRHGKRPKNFRKFTKYVTQYHPRNVACNGDATEAARTRQAAKPERRQKKVHACEGPRAGPTGGCGGQQGRLEQVTHEDEFNQSKPTLHPITDDEIFLRILCIHSRTLTQRRALAPSLGRAEGLRWPATAAAVMWRHNLSCLGRRRER